MYNRYNAVAYATQYWNKRNPNFYDFEKLGGDCTNFISQCLLAGGYIMDKSKWGWQYTSINDRSYSWTGVNELYNYLITNTNSLFPKAIEVPPQELDIGDIVQFDLFGTTYHHTGIITKLIKPHTLNNIFITCHTKDALNKPLSEYKIKRIRYLKML